MSWVAGEGRGGEGAEGAERGSESGIRNPAGVFFLLTVDSDVVCDVFLPVFLVPWIVDWRKA